MNTEAHTLYLAYRDPRTPWYARAWLALVLGYLASPIDLIPDFIPVIGHLDDLLLVPAGLALAVRMIPGEVLDECRKKAAQGDAAKPLRIKAPRPVLILSCAAVAALTALAVFCLSSHYRSHREAVGPDTAGGAKAADAAISPDDVVHFDVVCRGHPGQLLCEMLLGDSIEVVDTAAWRESGTIRAAADRGRFIRAFGAVLVSRRVARSSGDGCYDQEYLESYAIPERYRPFVSGLRLPDPQID